MKITKQDLLRLSFPLLFAAILSTPLKAQNYAQITGTVADPSAAMVVSATITATNTATAQTREVQTNATGNYTIPFLVPGIYDLTVGHEGFKTASREGVELQLGDVARVDFQLEVGTVTEVVEVTGAAPMLNSENSVVGTVIENRRIVELPLNGRNYLQMIALTSNVTAEMSSRHRGQRPQGWRASEPGFLDCRPAQRLQPLHAGRHRKHRAQLRPVRDPSFDRRPAGVQGPDRSVLSRVRPQSVTGDRRHEVRDKPVSRHGFRVSSQ